MANWKSDRSAERASFISGGERVLDAKSSYHSDLGPEGFPLPLFWMDGSPRFGTFGKMFPACDYNTNNALSGL